MTLRTILALYRFSVAGLAMSLMAHAVSGIFKLNAVRGMAVVFLIVLHLGAMVVLVGAIWAGWGLVRRQRLKGAWRLLAKHTPVWTRVVFSGTWVYAVVSFYFLWNFLGGVHAANEIERRMALGFSAHWMAIYSAAAVVFCSATRENSPRASASAPTS